jgi:DNA-binding transcriptional regulator WhiA
MPYFIELKEQDRIKLFVSLKKKFGKSWNKIYPDFGISRGMFFNYLSGRNYLPEEIFFKMQKISMLNLEPTKRISIENHLKKSVKKPRMNKELAEILGIINGDGHLSKNGKELCIVGSSLESDYLEYAKALFERNFELKFTTIPVQNTLKIRVYSIKLVKILNCVYGLPLGKKTGKLKIPKQLFKSKRLLSSYIRGLFDTDGTIYTRRKKDIVVEIVSADSNYLNQIKRVLFLLNISSGVSGKHLYIYKKSEIIKFFNVIKPNNSKHLKRFARFKKLARW